MASNSGSVLICLMIKTVDEQQFPISISSSATIPELKEQISTKLGIQSQRQRLIFRGKVLKNDKDISAYAIGDGHTLHLVVRPAGSTESPPPSASSLTSNSTSNASQQPEINSRVLMGATIAVPDGTELSGGMLHSILSNFMGNMDTSSGSTSISIETLPFFTMSSTVSDGTTTRIRRSTTRRSRNQTRSGTSAQQSIMSRNRRGFERIDTLSQSLSSNTTMNTSTEWENQEHLTQFNQQLERVLGAMAENRTQLLNIPRELGAAADGPSSEHLRNSIALLEAIGSVCSGLARAAQVSPEPRARRRSSSGSFFEDAMERSLYRAIFSSGREPSSSSRTATQSTNDTASSRVPLSGWNIDPFMLAVRQVLSSSAAQAVAEGDQLSLHQVCLDLKTLLTDTSDVPGLTNENRTKWAGRFMVAFRRYWISKLPNETDLIIALCKIVLKFLPSILEVILRFMDATARDKKFATECCLLLKRCSTAVITKLNAVKKDEMKNMLHKFFQTFASDKVTTKKRTQLIDSFTEWCTPTPTATATSSSSSSSGKKRRRLQ